MNAAPPPGSGRRLILPDLIRALALIGMATFHFTFDLQNFGFIAPGTIFEPGWMTFARSVAGTFIFMAGFSLILAHRRGFLIRPFLMRLGQLIAAAALVSVATCAVMPEVFIYYGVLHSIAVCSVLGAVLMRLPWPILTALGAGAIWAHLSHASPAFNHPWLWWLGLSTRWRPTVDFEPLLPWFGPFLIGMAAAKLADGAGWLARLPCYRPGETGKAPGIALGIALRAGRHTLPIYLLHQPVLFGLTWAAAQVLR